ncbi:MAG: hypothetical protein ACRCS9_12375 [Hyphomicrobium sp.]
MTRMVLTTVAVALVSMTLALPAAAQERPGRAHDRAPRGDMGAGADMGTRAGGARARSDASRPGDAGTAHTTTQTVRQPTRTHADASDDTRFGAADTRAIDRGNTGRVASARRATARTLPRTTTALRERKAYRDTDCRRPLRAGDRFRAATGAALSRCDARPQR